MKRNKKDVKQTNRDFIDSGVSAVKNRMIFRQLVSNVSMTITKSGFDHDQAYGYVSNKRVITLNERRKAAPQAWEYVICHCLLHLSLGHMQGKDNPLLWNRACDCYIYQFLDDLGLRAPEDLSVYLPFSGKTEEEWYTYFLENGYDQKLDYISVCGYGKSDMKILEIGEYEARRLATCERLLASGISEAVTSAITKLSGEERKPFTLSEQARRWFVDHFPLLGALASNFELIEDTLVCQNLDVSVAAIDVFQQEIYINPAAGLNLEELKFVLAHEFLHAGLCHASRRNGRDHYLWNVACDYVINDWLVQMNIGKVPEIGILLDEEARGLSAESLYDRIVRDIRTNRKLRTLRGVGLGDILYDDRNAIDPVKGQKIDDFCKNALSIGLTYHQAQNRGFLPAGLIEEIQALYLPPIPWDVELARWFDGQFQPMEKYRSYARLSRRQSATPEIPRPSYVTRQEDLKDRTFGVIIDTSSSMDQRTLAKGLGAVASYAVEKDVPLVRVIFCDALPYDAGYLSPEEIADRVQVQGRGGTVLQPAVDFLTKQVDFPREAPILIITDGFCDRLKVTREHAYLMAKYGRAPFNPKGPVFRIT